ncbi:MAG: NUDIX domain-containing protein [Oscillospiraceae bacterium]|nr:NUDIX domain-containing protein [Oscillospiraceae bacterium]
MHTRLLVGAFLTYQNKVLLMKRGMHKELGPGMWSGIGGHLEHEELSNPRKINFPAAIYREIKEEAGISQENILNLDLRYIITQVNRTRGEIQNLYYYFGKVGSEFEPPYCDEGVFHWVDFKDIKDLPMSFCVKETILHWLDNPDKNNIFLVGINKNNDKSLFVKL